MKAKIAQFLILCILFTMVRPLNVWAADSMTFAMDENYVNGNIYSTVRGVMSHEGNYVAWGQYGNIQTSSDGIKWTSGNNTWSNDSVAGNLYNIVYNDVENKYVGIGKNCFASSSDGKKWKSEASAQNINNNDLLYANGNYYGVSSGYGGRIQKSTDGKNWQNLSTGLPNSNVGSTDYYNLNAITFGNGKYIAVGSQGKVLSSNDGESWNNQTLGVSPSYLSLIDVIYAGGKYVIVGSGGTIYTSDDGASWVKRDSGLTGYQKLCSISYGHGKYVVVGGSETLTSTDGINWSGTSTNIQLNNSICFDSSGFVTTSGIIYHSSDGTNWTKVDKPSSQTISYISDLQFLNGQYVAVGNGFMISPDGVAWSRKNDNEVLNRISYGNGKYVGIGNSKTYSTIVKTSTNGVTWQPQTVNVPDSLWQADITFGSGKFVLVGNQGLILYSANGTNWTKSISGVTSSLRSVLFSNGRFIAAGDNGTILYSSDGVTWTPASSTESKDSLQDLAYGDGQIVGVGYYTEGSSWPYTYHGVIISSLDGINWTKRSPSTGFLNGVSYGSGRFVVTGDAGTVLSSTDGATWSTESPFTTGELGMIASNGSGFLIGRTIVDSDLLFRSTNTNTNTNTLQSIAITTPATKLSYSIGDKLDITGLVVTGTYSDGSTKVESITAANVKGFNSSKASTNQVLTIKVGTKTTIYNVQILTVPITPVTGVSLKAISSSEIDLSWDTVNGVKSYTIYRATSENGNYSKVGSAKTASYKNTKLKPSTSYWYKVTAVITGEESGFSDIQAATTLPLTPSGVKAKAASSTAVTLTWKAIGGSTFNVYRSSTQRGEYTKIEGELSTASYNDMNLTPKTTYWYKVTALDSNGNESVASAPVKGLTKAR